jgi:hypothetical protein
MAVLLKHEDVVFDDETIYSSGNAYKRCTFNRCVIVVRDTPGVFEDCGFSGCIWHVDILVHDSDQWDAFMSGIASMITKTLPRLPKSS